MFNLYEKQQIAINNANRRINLLDGSVRSGKTYGSFEWWVRYITHDAPPGNLLMTGKTIKALERNVLQEIKNIVPCTWSLHNKTAYICGRRIEIEGANDRRAEDKIRGMTIAGHYGDEITLWPESYFKQSLARMSVKDAMMIGTTNPDSPRHWLMKDYISRRNELDMSYSTLLIEDNEHLDPKYVDSIKKEYTGLWYKRFILSQWVSAEGAIYDMFDEKIHVVNEVPRCYRYWFSGDYGTATTTVFLLFGQANDGKIYVIKEFTHDAKKAGRQKTDGELKEDLNTFAKGIVHSGVYFDPSAASFMLLCSREPNRIRMLPAVNDVVDGIRFTATLLANGLLYISKNCPKLIENMYSYVWDENAQDNGIDKPMKKDDHHADSLRYGIASTRKYWKGLLQ